MNTRTLLKGKRTIGKAFKPHSAVWVILITLLTLSANPFTPLTTVQAVSTCVTSTASSGLYTVTVCIDSPGDLNTVSGMTSIVGSASMNPAPPPGAANPVQKLVFYVDHVETLTDFQAPYTFLLPSQQWVDGSHQLSLEAVMRDGFHSSLTMISLNFANGVITPPVNTKQFTPASATAPGSGSPLIVAAVGDSASGEANVNNVVNLIASWNPNLFLYLGDVYEQGSYTEFINWYGQGGSFLDRFRSITNPTVGNHEYDSTGHAPGYFNYWNNPPHYYSFNANGWHFVSLDSNTAYGPTGAGSPEYQWLANDLSADRSACTLVYWHHPLYNIGKETPAINMQDIWTLLVQNKVDLVLTGHDHDYQRWVPLNGSGLPATNGVTQFVVGTGGHGIQTFATSDSRVALGFDSATSPLPFGALRLKLYGTFATYDFINTAGTTLDTGNITCKNAPAGSGPTATPTLTRTPTPTRTPIPTKTPTATPRNHQSGGINIYIPNIRR